MNLREYIYSNGFLIKEFAEKIGMHSSYLSSCLNGKRRFSRRVAFKIKEITCGQVSLEEDKDHRVKRGFKNDSNNGI